MQINHPLRVEIGALGELPFPKGLYAYVGSAQNNLELRVKRHQRKNKRLFWHIDYLLNNEAAKIVAVYFSAQKKTEECSVARMIEAMGTLPVRGFGCSDCTCESHLFLGKSFEFLADRMQPFRAS